MKCSAVIITRNEQENISECIKSLSFADEIIVVDNDSKDQTADLARKLGATVYVITGLDFSYLRNIGKEKARFEWIFYVDADERVTDELARQIKSAVKSSKYSAYSIKRKNYFLGKEVPGLETINRLIKKDCLIGWQGILHETPIISGSIGELAGELLHYTHRDITSMVEKTNEWSDLEARLLYKSGHPLMAGWRFIRIMVSSFFRSYITNKCYRMGAVGLIESIYQSFSSFITYAKLWERQNRKTGGPKQL